jgi:signal transduction histidine kinase
VLVEGLLWLLVIGVALLYGALGSSPGPLPLALLVSLSAVATWCPPPVSASATGATMAAAAALVTGHGRLTPDQVLAFLPSLVAAWLLGYGVRLNRARWSSLKEQAARRAHEQAEQIRLAVEQEQARLARELHDIIGHTLSVIVAQAAATQRVINAESELARQALGSIETTGRQGLVELRGLLGVLDRDPEKAGPATRPGLERLPALVAQLGSAGLPVELVVSGQARPLPAEVESSAYRIVQEALTNALRHAGPTRATVVLGYRPGALEVRVRDEGRGSAHGVAAGQGIVGMRHRAALLGGVMAAGPEPDGGFHVTASLPVGGERQ